MRRKVNQLEVSRVAGVERSCVSRILSNSKRADEYSAATRARVLEAAASLGYRKNLSALTVRRGYDNSTIAIICNFSGLTKSSEQAAVFRLIKSLNEHGYGAKVYCGPHTIAVRDEILSHQINYVYMSYYDAEDCRFYAEFCRAYGLRLMIYSPVSLYSDFPVVNGDNIRNMCAIVRYLHSHGHRHLLFHCAPHHYHPVIKIRHEGFFAGIAECGLDPDQQSVICQDFKEATLLRELINSQPTALCCTDPKIALQALHAATRWQINVPGDISIASYGFSNSNTVFEPHITGLNDENTDLSARQMIAYFTARGSSLPHSQSNQFHEGAVIEGESVAAPGSRSVLRKKLLPISRNVLK